MAMGFSVRWTEDGLSHLIGFAGSSVQAAVKLIAVIFEQQSPLSTHLFIQRFLQELEQTEKNGAGHIHKATHAITKNESRWTPPAPGLVKINVDGAVARGESKGAAACVCRDSNGVFLGASATVYVGVSNPEVLEAMAVSEALYLATNMHERKLHIVSDCLNVVKAINEDGTRGEHCMIIREILEKRREFSVATFSHERREANGEAHRLARSSTTLDSGRHVWFAPPSHLGISVNVPIIE
jgi:ribonuclease HI